MSGSEPYTALAAQQALCQHLYVLHPNSEKSLAQLPDRLTDFSGPNTSKLTRGGVGLQRSGVFHSQNNIYHAGASVTKQIDGG